MKKTMDCNDCGGTGTVDVYEYVAASSTQTTQHMFTRSCDWCGGSGQREPYCAECLQTLDNPEAHLCPECADNLGACEMCGEQDPTQCCGAEAVAS